MLFHIISMSKRKCVLYCVIYISGSIWQALNVKKQQHFTIPTTEISTETIEKKNIIDTSNIQCF